MRSSLRCLFHSIALCLLLAVTAASQADAGPLYLNSYGSGWGVWLRGHYFLRETGRDYILEVERISVEPNRSYPQSFEISGFRLAYFYKDRRSGEALERDPVTGPPAAYRAKLQPAQPLIVEDMTIAVGKSVRPGENETLILELHVVTLSGASIGVQVGEFAGK